MRPLLASPAKNKIKMQTTKTTQHPVDRGLGGVGQRFSVEGAHTACALQLGPFTVCTQGDCPSHLRRIC